MTTLRGLVDRVVGQESPEAKKAKSQRNIKRAQLEDEIADLEIQLEKKREALEALEWFAKECGQIEKERRFWDWEERKSDHFNLSWGCGCCIQSFQESKRGCKEWSLE
jgi:hypothetical protein